MSTALLRGPARSSARTIRRLPIRRAIPLLALLLPSPTHAQDIQVRAFLSAERVGFGGQFVLNVEVAGAQQTDADPVLPDMERFGQYLGAGTSTSMQIANGRTSVTLTYQYRFQATMDGVFEIGPVKVTVGGRTYETEPVSLVVSDTPAPQGGIADSGEPADGVAPEDLFIETEVSRSTAFENEPVVISYRLLRRVALESARITTLPQATGFWTEELELPDPAPQERVVRDGSEYVATTFRRVVLFPTGAGARTLEPLGIEGQVRVPDRRRQSLFGDFFGGASPFDRRVPVAVASRPVTIEVQPLPAEGRPASFTGHVGELDITATVDRPSVAANEAVTYRVDVTGAGNLRALTPPEINFPDEFETFPPETTDRIAPGGGSIRGTRTYEYVLIPRAPGSVTIPPVEVSYFDARSRSYGTARSQPVEIAVTGDAAAPGAETGAVPSAVESIRDEIRFIHIGTPDFRRTGIPLHSTAGFWIVLLLPVAAVAGATAVRRHRDRIEGDVAYARVRRARRMARKRLARAKGLAAGDPREFYAEVAGALQGFLADRLNVAEAGLVREEAGGLARRRGVSDRTLERLFACLDDCDLQRFAPAGAEREAPERVLDRAAAIMGDLAKELSS
ncbi:MAG: BatD family protein [Gemmatimonadota bacterium]|nr:BatD family protein [bacterium]MDE2875754.1 BatD family protein [Gemmatimonadota bacterium]